MNFARLESGNSVSQSGCIKMGRLKTGTCPRIDAKSIDFSQMEVQAGDENPIAFSFRTQKDSFNPTQLPCYVTYTNENTHQIIESNFYRAPLFTGQIEGVGPRYKLNKHALIDQAECYWTPSGKLFIIISQRFPILRIMCHTYQYYYIDNNAYR